MNTALVVAYISAAVALVSAAFSGWTQLHLTKRGRRLDAKAVLDRYRGPLLDAAWQLGDRLENIRHGSFFDYLSQGSGREQDAKLTTLFRFAYYLGWRESSVPKSSSCGSRTRRAPGGSLGSSMTSHGCSPATGWTGSGRCSGAMSNEASES